MKPVSMLRLCLAALALIARGQPVSRVWVADRGDGTYQNPILYADYSDPDIVRVKDDFYMTASSFDAVPGLPVLHSKDLVNWELIGHVYAVQPPVEVYSKPQHGNGAWAPSIRYRNGEFYIFYPDPDYGIYMVKATDPAGPWSAPLLIKSVTGWIDPCPLWDDDGKAYLVTAVAASRAAMKSSLIVSRMSPDGTRLLDGGALVFDGHGHDDTVEGPKFYKRNGYYYIAAPAGGVEPGWQLVLRSRNVYGPYERRVVLSKGDTAVNGPHQGGWVDTPTGEFWFIHFQEKGPWGRILHLEPMQWVDDWPVMGDNGHPVATHKKPNVGQQFPVVTPADSDEFNSPELGLQWQWQANPKPNWMFPAPGLGFLRLFCVPVPVNARNLWETPNLLLQKLDAPQFMATARLTFHPQTDDEKTGLVMMGMDYAYVAVKRKGGRLEISRAVCKHADRGWAEQESAPAPVEGDTVFLRVRMSDKALCRFSYSTDGTTFHEIGDPFTARPGRWIGAKVGLFAIRNGATYENGYADYDWFRIEN